MIGLHLSHYAIESELGRGGMGIVFRAKDTTLNRTVALKVLPAGALASEDDRARFRREAQAAAQLNHPNVCHVYQVDEAQPLTPDGKPVEGHMEPRLFIAMEYIDGETLHDYVKKGPLKLQEAVNIAGQVAEALKEAHAKDIVHRDIKSANVMLTEGGVAKVLDFGLAKTNQSTMLTRMGSTLGTVAYMSPEQARGQEVDGRSDLYSLGTMLYEMVAGRLPYTGDYEQAVLYGILNEAPEPLTAVRTGVPMQLEWVVEKLLKKEAEYRYQSAAGLLADLKSLDLSGRELSRPSISAMRPGPQAASGHLRPAPGYRAWGVASLLLAAGALGWVLWPTPEVPIPPTLKLSVNTGSVEVLSHLAVSPDRAYVAFRGQNTLSGEAGTFVYEMRSRTMRHVPGSAAYWFPNFSPDSRWLVLANLAGGLGKVPIRGGRPVAFSDRTMRGWFSADELFVTNGRGLATIDLNGNPTGRMYQADSSVYPDPLGAAVMLPGGRSFLTTSRPADGQWSDLLVFNVKDGTYKFVMGGVTRPQYVDSGHIVYFANIQMPADLMAQPFDAARGELTGEAVPMGLEADFRIHALTEDGVMAVAETRYFRRLDAALYWVGIDGGERTNLGLPTAGYLSPRFSNAGDLLAVSVRGEDRNEADVFVVDLATGLDTRRTSGGFNDQAAWSPDDRWLYYRRSGPLGIVRRLADGSGQPEYVSGGSDPDISLDGRWLAFFSEKEGSDSHDIFVQARGDSSDVWHLVLPGRQLGPRLSPDGRYVAFYTAQNEREEVHVHEVGGTSSFVVSRPEEVPDRESVAWSRDGNYIYYSNFEGEIRRARISLNPVFRVIGHETVASPAVTGFSANVGRRYFALHPDGERLLVAVPQATADRDGRFSIDVTLDIQEELNRIAPPRN